MKKKNTLGFNEIYAFGKGEVPEWVQRWNEPSAKTDILFLATHPDDDILFLGSAVYAGGVDNAIKMFLEENKDNIGVLYNISTASLLPSTYKQVKKIAEDLGIAVSEREYHCRGSFALLHRGHPDEGDLARARSFTKQVLDKAGK